MASKHIFVFTCCCLALTLATPIPHVPYEDAAPAEDTIFIYTADDEAPQLTRHVRELEGNALGLMFRNDQYGNTGAIQANKNLYSSADGQFKFDAYAEAARQFDHNQNQFNVGFKYTF